MNRLQQLWAADEKIALAMLGETEYRYDLARLRRMIRDEIKALTSGNV